jgi:hypothetical protein
MPQARFQNPTWKKLFGALKGNTPRRVPPQFLIFTASENAGVRNFVTGKIG